RTHVSKRSWSSSPSVSGQPGQSATVHKSVTPFKSAGASGTKPRLRVQASSDSGKISSKSKTADLGLRKPQSPPSDLIRGQSAEPVRVLSRVAAAVASMRAAIAPGAVRTSEPPKTTPEIGQPL